MKIYNFLFLIRHLVALQTTVFLVSDSAAGSPRENQKDEPGQTFQIKDQVTQTSRIPERKIRRNELYTS